MQYGFWDPRCEHCERNSEDHPALRHGKNRYIGRKHTESIEGCEDQQLMLLIFASFWHQQNSWTCDGIVGFSQHWVAQRQSQEVLVRMERRWFLPWSSHGWGITRQLVQKEGRKVFAHEEHLVVVPNRHCSQMGVGKILKVAFHGRRYSGEAVLFVNCFQFTFCRLLAWAYHLLRLRRQFSDQETVHISYRQVFSHWSSRVDSSVRIGGGVGWRKTVRSSTH